MAEPIPVHITWSSNSKTGHMPVSTTGSKSCPSDCKHNQLGTCYAKMSFLGIHWRKVDSGERDMGFDNFIRFVSDLPKDQLWRHNQAGDIQGVDNRIDERKFLQLVEANKGKRGFTYTHKKLTPKNTNLINYANANGFTVNVSCDSVADALILKQKLTLLGYNIPVVCTVPEDYEVLDNHVKICPAQLKSDITCTKCQWCANAQRKFIVAFIAHGSKRKVWK